MTQEGIPAAEIKPTEGKAPEKPQIKPAKQGMSHEQASNLVDKAFKAASKLLGADAAKDKASHDAALEHGTDWDAAKDEAAHKTALGYGTDQQGRSNIPVKEPVIQTPRTTEQKQKEIAAARAQVDADAAKDKASHDAAIEYDNDQNPR